jgi:hypothetical protein
MCLISQEIFILARHRAQQLLSVGKKWIDATGAIGLHAKAGRYGGTYTHRDIAFEFGSWLSALQFARPGQRPIGVETRVLTANLLKLFRFGGTPEAA